MNKHNLKMYSLIQKPLLTHKSYKALEKDKYTFLVNSRSTKHSIKKAIEEFFDVKTKKINIINLLGKKKFYKQVLGKRSDKKKAIVTLQKGYKIEEIQAENN